MLVIYDLSRYEDLKFYINMKPTVDIEQHGTVRNGFYLKICECFMTYDLAKIQVFSFEI